MRWTLPLSSEEISTADAALDRTRDESDAIGVAQLLEEHRCEAAVVLDIAAVSDVADYFVIATVRSSAHLQGVYRYLLAYLKSVGTPPLTGHKRVRDERWLLVDCGTMVIHLMDQQAREFYELERLWFNAREVFHSSKSS